MWFFCLVFFRYMAQKFHFKWRCHSLASCLWRDATWRAAFDISHGVQRVWREWCQHQHVRSVLPSLASYIVEFIPGLCVGITYTCVLRPFWRKWSQRRTSISMQYFCRKGNGCWIRVKMNQSSASSTNLRWKERKWTLSLTARCPSAAGFLIPKDALRRRRPHLPRVLR